MRRAAAALAGAMLLLVACGDDDGTRSSSTATAPPGAGDILLTIRHDDGAGGVGSGELTCRPDNSAATGDLAKLPSIARLCREARALAPLLTEEPPARRACTQIYGGPETARVRGTVAGHTIDRTFSRHDGCAIEDFERIKPILPPAS